MNNKKKIFLSLAKTKYYLGFDNQLLRRKSKSAALPPLCCLAHYKGPLLVKRNSTLFLRRAFLKRGPFLPFGVASFFAVRREQQLEGRACLRVFKKRFPFNFKLKEERFLKEKEARTFAAERSFEKSFYTSYTKLTEIKLITIGLASPERIRRWAEKTLPNGKVIGQVTNANTLHHKTFKPQKGGLFCERIFGPLKDFECACGKTQKPISVLKFDRTALINNNAPKTDIQNFEGQKHEPLEEKKSPREARITALNTKNYCPNCDVEYTWSIIRRYQLGYIDLVSPVTHVWYLKATPSYLSILLDIKKKHLEHIVYCAETMTLENSFQSFTFLKLAGEVATQDPQGGVALPRASFSATRKQAPLGEDPKNAELFFKGRHEVKEAASSKRLKLSQGRSVKSARCRARFQNGDVAAVLTEPLFFGGDCFFLRTASLQGQRSKGSSPLWGGLVGEKVGLIRSAAFTLLQPCFASACESVAPKTAKKILFGSSEATPSCLLTRSGEGSSPKEGNKSPDPSDKSPLLRSVLALRRKQDPLKEGVLLPSESRGPCYSRPPFKFQRTFLKKNAATRPFLEPFKNFQFLNPLSVKDWNSQTTNKRLEWASKRVQEGPEGGPIPIGSKRGFATRQQPLREATLGSVLQSLIINKKPQIRIISGANKALKKAEPFLERLLPSASEAALFTRRGRVQKSSIFENQEVLQASTRQVNTPIPFYILSSIEHLAQKRSIISADQKAWKKLYKKAYKKASLKAHQIIQKLSLQVFNTATPFFATSPSKKPKVAFSFASFQKTLFFKFKVKRRAFFEGPEGSRAKPSQEGAASPKGEAAPSFYFVKQRQNFSIFERLPNKKSAPTNGRAFLKTWSTFEGSPFLLFLHTNFECKTKAFKKRRFFSKGPFKNFKFFIQNLYVKRGSKSHPLKLIPFKKRSSFNLKSKEEHFLKKSFLVGKNRHHIKKSGQKTFAVKGAKRFIDLSKILLQTHLRNYPSAWPQAEALKWERDSIDKVRTFLPLSSIVLSDTNIQVATQLAIEKHAIERTKGINGLIDILAKGLVRTILPRLILASLTREARGALATTCLLRFFPFFYKVKNEACLRVFKKRSPFNFKLKEERFLKEKEAVPSVLLPSAFVLQSQNSKKGGKASRREELRIKKRRFLTGSFYFVKQSKKSPVKNQKKAFKNRSSFDFKLKEERFLKGSKSGGGIRRGCFFLRTAPRVASSFSLFLLCKTKAEESRPRTKKKKPFCGYQLVNNIYSLSHRYRWEHDLDWTDFLEYISAPIHLTDKAIPKYEYRLNPSPLSNLVSNQNSNSDLPLKGPVASLIQGSGGGGLIKKLLTELNLTALAVQSKQPKGPMIKNALQFSSVAKSGAAKGVRRIAGGSYEAAFSAAGDSSKATMEKTELNKMDKQNRILLFELNKQIFKLKQTPLQLSLFPRSLVKHPPISSASLVFKGQRSKQGLASAEKMPGAASFSATRKQDSPFFQSEGLGLPPFFASRREPPVGRQRGDKGARMEKHIKRRIKELITQRNLLTRRTKLVRKLFISSKTGQCPSSMILSLLPVLPPDLRPIVKMGNGAANVKIAASDLNRLYQRVIYRNERLKKFLVIFKSTSNIKTLRGLRSEKKEATLGAAKQALRPKVATRREQDPPSSPSGLRSRGRESSTEIKFTQGLLQEAVDNLIQNNKSGVPAEKDSRGRALKSLSDILKGKQGRFRQYLLGKRVDYSGRSVIIVGPKLKIHQCGIPKEMALELFLPFLLKRILNYNLARTVVGAKSLINTNKPLVWELLTEIMRVCPVLLNRAPTLHRLGIQAFIPKLVDGRAILLHPLVCSAFNADFDGDQMAVHVPITVESRAEAWKLMLSRNNLLSPATGEPISVPSQDMILGCYYLTTQCAKGTSKKKKGFGLYFKSEADVLKAYDQQKIDLHASVWLQCNELIEDTNEIEHPIEIRITKYGTWKEINPRSHINFYHKIPIGLAGGSFEAIPRLKKSSSFNSKSKEAPFGHPPFSKAPKVASQDSSFGFFKLSHYIKTTPGKIIFNSIIKNSIYCAAASFFQTPSQKSSIFEP